VFLFVLHCFRGTAPLVDWQSLHPCNTGSTGQQAPADMRSTRMHDDSIAEEVDVRRHAGYRAAAGLDLIGVVSVITAMCGGCAAQPEFGLFVLHFSYTCSSSASGAGVSVR
jgi:hypothetical protein